MTPAEQPLDPPDDTVDRSADRPADPPSRPGWWDRATVLAVAVPLAICLLGAGWLFWTRADPARQGGFCMNATVELAGILQASDGAESSGFAPLPDVADVLAQVDTIDPTRFEVDTPVELRSQVATLVAELPAHRAAVAEAARRGEPKPGPPPAVVGAFAEVAQTYLADCADR